MFYPSQLITLPDDGSDRYHAGAEETNRVEWIQGRTRFLLCISNEPIKWMIRYSFVRIRPYIELGRLSPICDDPRTRNNLYALFLDVEFFLLDSELGFFMLIKRYGGGLLPKVGALRLGFPVQLGKNTSVHSFSRL